MCKINIEQVTDNMKRALDQWVTVLFIEEQ